MNKVLVIDNYDSFTYNLVHLIKEMNYDVTVVRNDKFDLDDISKFDKILLSPGPGIPDEAGLLKKVIEKYGPTKSILGIAEYLYSKQNPYLMRLKVFLQRY